MKWKQPAKVKIYEALGTVADGRVEVVGDTAKVYSSSGNKFYQINYNPDKKAIMSNDNGSYWQGYLGYPSIAFLLKIGVLDYKPELAKLLKGVKWKDINTKFKNNFDKALEHILSSLNENDRKELADYVESLYIKIKDMGLEMLGPKTKPPEGY